MLVVQTQYEGIARQKDSRCLKYLTATIVEVYVVRQLKLVAILHILP